MIQFSNTNISASSQTLIAIVTWVETPRKRLNVQTGNALTRLAKAIFWLTKPQGILKGLDAYCALNLSLAHSRLR